MKLIPLDETSSAGSLKCSVAEPAGEHRGLWLHVACENVILASMKEVSVTVAQLLFCVCLSGGSSVGRQPVLDWENHCFSFLSAFAAQELGKRKNLKNQYLSMGLEDFWDEKGVHK